MSRLASCFDKLRSEGRKALVPYLTAGDPDLNFTYAAALACVRGGADILEIGIPFSDPLADGPVIQAAVQRALGGGVSFAGVLELIRKLRAATDAPLVALAYYNSIYHRGEQEFVERCAAAGLDGLVVADLPVDESATLAAATRAAGIDLIRMVTPTSTPERLVQAAALASGFIYCVSLTGVTGAREQLPAELQSFLHGMRRRTETPLIVGFGIARPEQAVAVAAAADGVIVGSALVSHLAAEFAKSRHGAGAAAEKFMAAFRSALDAAHHR